MELATGTPDAEFGDKTSLIAQVTTRSGLGAGRLIGEAGTSYGSFGSPSANLGLGYGNAKGGNFFAADVARSGRFLDTPEFRPIHDVGNNQTIFDRADYQPNGYDAFHLNLFAARNWIQIPNSLDHLAQDQRQRVLTWNVAPGYQHVFGARALLTVNPYIRKDQFNYYASRNPLADGPATQTQLRQLLNWGTRAEITLNTGRHNIKSGFDLKQTRLDENFGFGITDPTYNAPGSSGYSPALALFDLTRGGSMFRFRSAANINQYALFVQDSITAGHFVVNAGIRLDRYAGLVTNFQPQPRLAVAYKMTGTGTVLRAAYARTMETPFNENLLLASSAGLAATIGATAPPVRPGFRNQFNAGAQQAVGRYVRLDADYFWKYTHNSYDFFTLLNTTITFPVAWHNSKIDGATGRVSTINLKGFQAYWTFGHTRARYFPPAAGGLISNATTSVFRIDHDQAFQSTLNMRYQRPRNREWISVTYRYDSGLVVSGVPDGAAALALTASQQLSIGLACDGRMATLTQSLANCPGTVTSQLINLPQAGSANADHNPARVKPRNVINLGIGTDDLLHSRQEARRRVTASVEIANLTGVESLYNFLSTFSGTHFLQPRTITAHIGYTF